MSDNALSVITVPDFTPEDFYSSTSPYDWLYQFEDNKFLQAQMRGKLKQKASDLGIRDFVALWNEYLKLKSTKKGIVIGNATAYEGQSIELFSGEYVCDDATGVSMYDRNGYETTVCRHPIIPVQRLINIDSGEERLKLEYKKGSAWRSTIVEKSVLASSNAILQLAANGVMVNSENAKQLSSYLLNIEDMNFDSIPEQKSVGRLGWVGEGFSPYVDNLVFDGETNFKHVFNAVQPSGDYQAWKDAMIDLRRTKGVGRLFLAASFASAILQPCGLLPFFLHAWGGTEVGKTVGLMIAASVWACPKMGEYITTFNATLVGQEMMATFLNSLPMCIDELQIQSSSGVKDFDKIIYQLTEGVGRTRGAKTGGLQKVNTWKNCFITNGEHPISNTASGGGAVNRIIEFECVEKVYHDLKGICDIVTANYGHAGKEFASLMQQEGFSEFVSQMQKTFYQQLLKHDSTDKQAASASAILAADYVATQFIFEDDNGLTVEDMAEIMTKKIDVDANARALEYITEIVARNPSRFYRNQYGEYSGEVWGSVTQDKGCIRIIKSAFDRIMLDGGFNSTAFLSWAKRRGLLDCEQGKRTKKVRISGTLTSCVCLYVDNLGE